MPPLGKWADGPFPLIQTPSATKDITDHTAHHIANEMAFAHNAMLRGLNSIYLQAPHVSAKDASDFLFFIASWSGWVLHHHNLEEANMFPKFEAVPGIQAGQLAQNLHQHELFASGLESLSQYAVRTPAGAYDGKRVTDLIDGFAQHMAQHLADEIDTLWSLDCCDKGQEKKLLQIYKDAETEAGKQDKSVVPPMVLGLCDKTFQDGNDWPAMPPGSAYFVHYIFARKHRGAWRFLPSDTFRTPRPLACLGSEEVAE
ncbi:hypothetical protein F5Y18DRAFT_426191 [Xylariaceae sp. FL1019]|nr:hypothetical protein F5Y18DRAFT_426191 [Xylariaceae sp. FL1019]